MTPENMLCKNGRLAGEVHGWRSVERSERPGIAPRVRQGLELPYQINDWHLIGPRWFERGHIDYFAELPTHFWESHVIFIEGAIRVWRRLTQRPPSIFVTRMPRKTIFRPGATKMTLNPNQMGYAELPSFVTLDASDAAIKRAFSRFLATKRKQLRLRYHPRRPSKIENLKRDLVVYILDRNEWDQTSIEAQLAYMGCKPLPNTYRQKALIRKIRKRFLAIEEEIAAETSEEPRPVIKWQ